MQFIRGVTLLSKSAMTGSSENYRPTPKNSYASDPSYWTAPSEWRVTPSILLSSSPSAGPANFLILWAAHCTIWLAESDSVKSKSSHGFHLNDAWSILAGSAGAEAIIEFWSQHIADRQNPIWLKPHNSKCSWINRACALKGDSFLRAPDGFLYLNPPT